MVEATKLWDEAEQLIESVTNGVNFYNILKTPNNTSSANQIMRNMPRTPRDDYVFKTPEVGKEALTIQEIILKYVWKKRNK